MFLLGTNLNAGLERTLAIIKPDVVKANKVTDIMQMIEKNGFKIVCVEGLQLNEEKAAGFYDVHKEKPFFNELIKFMISGPIIVMALEKDNAIKTWRELIGSTDPKDAVPESVRAHFGTSREKNAVHGSDALETAAFEVGYFFPNLQ